MSRSTQHAMTILAAAISSVCGVEGGKALGQGHTTAEAVYLALSFASFVVVCFLPWRRR